MLIIDEISMVSGELFHILEHRLRKMFDGTRPFGGKQVIVVGDFFRCVRCHACMLRVIM